MNRFNNRELADMHLVYGEARGNAREAVRIYADRFPHRNIPDSRTFTAIHLRLRETGSVRPRQRDPQREIVQPREQEILEYIDQHELSSP